MIVLRLGSLFVAFVALSPTSIAKAQNSETTEEIADAPQSTSSAQDVPNEVIVVTANRRRGEAEVAAESEFNEDEIAAEGADSISELLDRLTPFMSDSDDEPVLLINGEPVGFDRSILSYPPEALERIGVLLPEAASQYGEAPGKRVVNLVLKKSFASLTANASAEFPTAGEQHGGDLSLSRVAINGSTRWNVRGSAGFDTALYRDERSFPSQQDLVDTGGDLLPLDPDSYMTLLPSRRSASLAAGLTRPIGAYSVSLNLNANTSRTKGLRGLSDVSTTLPSDLPASLFGKDAALGRSLAVGRAFLTQNGSDTLGASLTVNGEIAGWQTSLATSYSRSWGRNFLETGIDVEAAQQLVDDADVNFGPCWNWDEDLILANRSRTHGENLSVQLRSRDDIAELVAGPLVVSLAANASRNRTTTRQSGEESGSPEAASFTRHRLDGQISVTVPISSRGGREGELLGDLSVVLTAKGRTLTDTRAQTEFGGDVTWSPVPILRLRWSFDYAGTAPSFEQLDAPIVTEVTRIFDYATQEVAEPIRITGGNPLLERGNRRRLNLNASIRPFGDQRLSLAFGYRQRVEEGGVTSFPELTPSIEAALPERVTRDAQGRLIAIDARAINVVRETNAAVTSAITLRLGQPSAASSGSSSLHTTLSINLRWQIESELMTMSGQQPIDQLENGNRSRHNFSIRATLGKRGLGTSLSGTWSSTARIIADYGILKSKPPLVANLSMFFEPEHLFDSIEEGGIMTDLKLSLDVNNVLNDYRRFAFEDGALAPEDSRYEIDPLGRTVRISIRKRF